MIVKAYMYINIYILPIQVFFIIRSWNVLILGSELSVQESGAGGGEGVRPADTFCKEVYHDEDRRPHSIEALKVE